MKHLAALFLLSLNTFLSKGQQFDKNLNTDSLFHVFIKSVPANLRKDITTSYNASSSKEKEFMLMMLLMPESSKKQLIQNIDTNYQNIWQLKMLYDNLVPKGMKVYVEFHGKEVFFTKGESIDFWCSAIDSSGNSNSVFQEWDVELASTKLDSLLKIVGWQRSTIEKIKNALHKANCISITNGEPSEIGFARSGMGKYFYSLFSTSLTPKQIAEYNDKCTYIYYKKNIVLQYGGGAIGSQCFPDKD
jgi:hypothetical protein